MRLELQGTMGRAGSELLSIAKYYAIAIGNNEGFAGVKVVESLATTGCTQFLSCNLYKLVDNSSTSSIETLIPLEGVKRNIILEKVRVRFLIIGTSPYGEYNEFYNLCGLHSTDAINEVKKELEENKNKYDISILLSHCGMREDTEIANSVDGIDIIINGHSHILMDKAIKVNNSIIHMSGCFGEH